VTFARAKKRKTLRGTVNATAAGAEEAKKKKKKT